MKKEWLLIIVSVSLTMITALLLVRWFAPQLLGIPADLQMVRVAREIPPFFDGVFRSEDKASDEFILQDPYIKRAKPLFPVYIGLGPHDILGFRNKSIPDVADIITIGDSQTYGNNVFLRENWPSSMVEDFEDPKPILYNMSVGGWGAAEYFEIFNKALYFRPKVVLVAFYTGNDPIDTFNKVYNDERWKSLRLNPNLASSDAPSLEERAEWRVRFQNGAETVFTPNLRYISNKKESPAAMVGYELMGEIAKKMGQIAEKEQVKLIFTIIPTKELAFRKKIELEHIQPREDYRKLVEDEEQNLRTFAEKLQNTPGTVYVDLLTPLQQTVIDSPYIYPEDWDGHPVADGYKLIGEILGNEVRRLLPPRMNGLYFARYAFADDEFRPLLITTTHFYIITTKKILEENGWSEDNMIKINLRDLSKLSFGGFINTVNPSRFGPEAFKSIANSPGQ